MKEQTQDILGQIADLLKQAGSDKTKILKANIWLTDIKTWAEMNEAWDAWVAPGETPARATVESKLAGPGLDVEIMTSPISGTTLILPLSSAGGLRKIAEVLGSPE